MIKKRIIKICVCLFAVILSGGGYSFAVREKTPFVLETGAISEPYRMTGG